jgi:hypothetical protein
MITRADVARVARQYDLPPVVANGLAADVALSEAIRAERRNRRTRLEPRKARASLLARVLEREELRQK